MKLSGFDLLSPIYEWAAWIGSSGAVIRSQRALLSSIPSVESILIVGGGNGRAAGHLILHAKPKRMLYVESSQKMAASAASHLLKTETTIPDGWQFMVQPIQSLQTTEKFDLISTGFFFDLFPEDEAKRIFQKLDGMLKPGGIFHYTDFIDPRLVESTLVRLFYRIYLSLLYQFFQIVAGISGNRPPSLPSWLEENGYKTQIQRSFLLGTITTGLYKKR